MGRHVESIGRVCYKSEDKITYDSFEQFLRMLIDRGHEAMIEHSMLSVLFTVDRGFTHELVRMRMASFAQESTRYCNYNKGKFDGQITIIQPPWIESDVTGEYNIEDFGLEYANDDSPEAIWIGSCLMAERNYQILSEKGWTPEKARAVLPNSLKADIVITCNFREWRHILGLRADTYAHPQMREQMIPLLLELNSYLPCVFGDIVERLKLAT
jgi:thymidylate synthase (FAD)